MRGGAIAPQVLERAIEAAQSAPCHRHTWPWRFARLGPVGRSLLASVAVHLKSVQGPLSADKAAAIRDKLLEPAEVLLLGCTKQADPGRQREDLLAVACAAQNFMLSLHADGLATKWSTGAASMAPDVLRHAGWNTDDIEPMGALFVGYPVGEVAAPPRPALTSVFSHTD